MTEKINLLKKVENHMAKNLNSSSENGKIAMLLAKLIANMIHETQKERGMTAGFIGSNGKSFAEQLPNQRLEGNKRIAILLQEVQKLDIFKRDKKLQDDVALALNSLNKIDNTREKIDNFTLSLKDALAYYTSNNAKFLTVIADLITGVQTAKETRELASFYNFLMAKERAGIERAVLTNSFTRNKFLPGMKEKFVKLITEQESFTTAFLAVADAKTRSYYLKTMDNKVVNEVNRMRNIALDATTIGGFDVKADYWFEMITKKINLLKNTIKKE